MSAAGASTPMFRQYRALKQQHRDAILLFRMGDFYEMFYEDAKTASRLLEITLTARGKGTDNVAPMCGFPHHQLDAYTAKLVGQGQRVAVCEQMEDPRKTKGLVKREVVRVVTPGTLADPAVLEASENRWLGGVAVHGGKPAAAFLDLSTGEFLAWQTDAAGDAGWEQLGERLREFAAPELVYPEGFPWSERFRNEHCAGVLTGEREPYAFSEASASDLLQRHFKVASLDGFGLRDRPAAVAAAGGLLAYVQETQRCGLEHVDAVLLHEPASRVLLDPATRRNLELDRSQRDGRRQASLVHAIDETQTAGGARLLRRWLGAPLVECEAIERRLDAVEELLARGRMRSQLVETLKQVRDIERLLAKTVARTAGPRDLAALSQSLQRLPELRDGLAEARCALVRERVDGMDPCADVAGWLAKALVEEPPAGAREGGVLRDGYHEELDELRAVSRDGRSTIAGIEAREREATGIGSLKVKFNKVFGYFIEVSKSNLRHVPEHYERKQTLASAERFVTPELKEYESKVLGAQERIEELEFELFVALRTQIAGQAPRIKAAAQVVAQLDVLASFARCAERHGYRRPRIEERPALRIVGGRHPVVEQSLADRSFVPNDTELDGGGGAILILTGPNMGGKSTFLRQVALISLLAQAGSFVPADEAELGIVDRIFCRVGASDSLAEGQSTFMVEMTETANILHHCTPRSLILLDEIGRGTSTFDGLSIAWAVVEHLHEALEQPPRTLFATHYHELTELAVERRGVVNGRMAVRECGDDVVFMHRVEPGASDRSYGIQVARLAGVPDAVVGRAREILANLERDEYGQDGRPRRARRAGGAGPDDRQASLFTAPAAAPAERRQEEDPAAAEVLAELRACDAERLTPLDALQKIAAWNRQLEGGEKD